LPPRLFLYRGSPLDLVPCRRLHEPFCGSGTSIIAAETIGRICHAIEIDPIYVDVAITRWQDFTGRQATLADEGRTFSEVASARKEAAGKAAA